MPGDGLVAFQGKWETENVGRTGQHSSGKDIS